MMGVLYLVSTTLTTLVLLLLVPISLCCDQDRFVGTNGSYVIKSPYFPNDYPPHLNCEFHYEASLGYKVRIQITSFTLESGNAYGICAFDFLQLVDGENEYAQEFGTYCDTDGPSNVIVTTGRHLFVLFHTDGSIQAAGFRGEVTVVPADYREPLPTPDPDSCTNIFSQQSGGAFYTPGYPNSYNTDQLCTYIVSIPDGSQHVLLRFTAFDIEPSYECVYDYVEVRDGSSNVSPLIGRFCGGSSNRPPDLIESSGPEIHVVFHSDISATFEGFYAEFASSDAGFATEAPQGNDGDDKPMEKQISVCDFSHALMTDRGGIIVSHQSYPDGTYGAGLTCAMIIVGSRTNEKIFINVIDMDIPDRQPCGRSGDFLRIIDGDQSNSPDSQTNLATLCGTDTGQYTSSFLFSVIQFTSNETPDPEHSGFKLVYSIYYEDAYGCLDDDFYCSNDRCIDSSLKCDGYDHCGDNSDETKGCRDGEGEEIWVIAVSVVVAICVMSLGACLAFLVIKNIKTPPPQNRNMDTNALTTISGSTSANSSRGVSQPAGHINPTYAASGTLSASATSITPDVQPPSYSQIFDNPVHPPNNPPSAPVEKQLYPKQEYTMFLASGLDVGPTAPPASTQNNMDNNTSPRIGGDPLPDIRSAQGSGIVQLPPLMGPGPRADIQRNNTLPSLPPIRGTPNAQSPNNNP